MSMKCLNCKKELIHRQLKYCSNKCQKEYENYQKILQWKKGDFNGIIGQYGLSKTIRNYLLEKANYQCEICGWNQTNPFTGLIPLEIHHKDGNYQNNIEENLQVLCPNCHALTINYKGNNKGHGRDGREQYRNRKNLCKDCQKPISSTAIRCRDCENKRRINNSQKPVSREELKKLIRTTPFTKIGKKYHVSDNAVKKWCISYNLPFKKIDIKKFSDIEWDLI